MDNQGHLLAFRQARRPGPALLDGNPFSFRLGEDLERADEKTVSQEKEGVVIRQWFWLTAADRREGYVPHNPIDPDDIRSPANLAQLFTIKGCVAILKGDQNRQMDAALEEIFSDLDAETRKARIAALLLRKRGILLEQGDKAVSSAS